MCAPRRIVISAKKTLRNYRRLFIAERLDEVLFRRMTDRLVRAFCVDTSRQRMDLTALRSAMGGLTRLGIVVETISKFARFQYTPPRAENQKRRLYGRSDTFREIYRWRAGIEATMSRLNHQMNLAHLRARGMPAMRYTVNLRALGLNIRRCAAVQA